MWSSSHLHPSILSLSLIQSLCFPFTASLSLSFIQSISSRFLSVRSPYVCLPDFLLLSHSLHLIHSSVSYSVRFNSISLLYNFLSPLYFCSVSHPKFHSTHAFCQHCLYSHSYSCKLYESYYLLEIKKLSKLWLIFFRWTNRFRFQALVFANFQCLDTFWSVPQKLKRAHHLEEK